MPDVLPEHLEVLVFGDSFNESLEGLPKKLRRLTLGYLVLLCLVLFKTHGFGLARIGFVVSFFLFLFALKSFCHGLKGFLICLASWVNPRFELSPEVAHLTRYLGESQSAESMPGRRRFAEITAELSLRGLFFGSNLRPKKN